MASLIHLLVKSLPVGAIKNVYDNIDIHSVWMHKTITTAIHSVFKQYKPKLNVSDSISITFCNLWLISLHFLRKLSETIGNENCSINKSIDAIIQASLVTAA